MLLIGLIGLLLTCFLLFIPLTSAFLDDPHLEPNDAGSTEDAGNEFDTAMEITLNDTYTGTLNPTFFDYSDFYKFKVAANNETNVVNRVLVTVYPPVKDIAFELYDPNEMLVDFDVVFNPASEPRTLEFYSNTGGYWFVAFYGRTEDGIITYNFTVSVTSVIVSPQDDANSGMDAGNTISEALPISSGTYNATFNRTWDVTDFYKIFINESMLNSSTNGEVGLYVETNSVDFSIFIVLYYHDNSTGRYNAAEYSIQKDPNDVFDLDQIIARGFSQPGWYYMRFSAAQTSFSSAHVNYQFTVEIRDVDPNQSDANSGRDAPDTIEAALPIRTGNHAGYLNYTDFDTTDLYKFFISQDNSTETLIQKINVTLTVKNASDVFFPVQVWLLSPSGEMAIARTIDDDTVNVLENIGDDVGWWYIEVLLSGTTLLTVEYQFELNMSFIVPLKQDDANTGIDAPDYLHEVVDGASFKVPVELNGTLDPFNDDETDYYAFKSDKDQEVIVTVTPSSDMDIKVALYYYNVDGFFGSVDFIDEVDHRELGGTESLVIDVERNVRYFLQVEHVAGSGGTYQVSIVGESTESSTNTAVSSSSSVTSIASSPSSGHFVIPGFQLSVSIVMLVTIVFFTLRRRHHRD